MTDKIVMHIIRSRMFEYSTGVSGSTIGCKACKEFFEGSVEVKQTPTLAPPAASSISSCTAGGEVEDDTQTEPASLKREDL